MRVWPPKSGQKQPETLENKRGQEKQVAYRRRLQIMFDSSAQRIKGHQTAKEGHDKQVAYRWRLQIKFASSDTEHQSPQHQRAENGQGRQRHTGGVCTWIVDSSPNNEASVIIAIRSTNKGHKKDMRQQRVLSTHRRRLEALPNLLRPSPRQHPPHKPLDLDRGLGTPAGRFLPLMRLLHQPSDQHLREDGVLANRSWHGEQDSDDGTGRTAGSSYSCEL